MPDNPLNPWLESVDRSALTPALSQREREQAIAPTTAIAQMEREQAIAPTTAIALMERKDTTSFPFPRREGDRG